MNIAQGLAHAKKISGTRIEFAQEALPKSGAGKILKRDLRDRYWAGKSRNVN